MSGLITPPKKTNISDELKKHSPTIAFFAGNILLLLGEVRVYDYVFTQTGEPWKAWFAVFASFIPFAIWELAVQHDKATGWMQLCAWVGMVISMGIGIAVGVADFVMVDGKSADSGLLMTLLALSLSVHALLLLAYFYLHPDQNLKRLMAKAIAAENMALTNARIAKSILSAARQRLAQQQSIAREFGEEELLKVLASLTGQEYKAPEQDEPASPPPAGQQLSDADLRRVAELLAVQLSASAPPGNVTKTPVGQVPLWPNGNNNGTHPTGEKQPPLAS